MRIAETRAVNRVLRKAYTTSTSRALFRAIEELERVQTARKARESSAASTAAESALPITETMGEQSASRAAAEKVILQNEATGPTKRASSDLST